MAYTLTGRKGGTVRFEPYTNGTVTQESVSHSSKVTSMPVEEGSDINDHVIRDPTKFNISGIIIGGPAAQETLKGMWEKRDIVTYTGRMRISDLVITSLSFDASSKNRDGVAFKASFQSIRIVGSQVMEMGSSLMSQQDGAEKTSNEGLKTAVSKKISESAYSNYVSTYDAKPADSGGPANRSNPSYDGTSQ